MSRQKHCPIVRYKVHDTVQLIRSGKVTLQKHHDGHAEVLGVIVGHNTSANFDVMFDAGSKYRGQTLNCHPDSCEMVKP